MLAPFKGLYESGREKLIAFDKAETFRADSVRFVRRAPILRGLTNDELYNRLLSGEIELNKKKKILIPVVAGGSEAGLYSITASGITTGTALKTLLELISSANVSPTVFQWWCEFNGSSAATAILTEFLRATASFTGGNAVTPSLLQPGRKAVGSSANSGVAASTNTTEGTRGAIIEQHYVPPTSGIVMQYPLSREPEIAVSDRMRISVTAGAAVSAAAGMMFSE